MFAALPIPLGLIYERTEAGREMMIKRRCALGAAVMAASILASNPAMALMCMQPDFKDAFAAAQKSEHAHRLFYGSIDIDETSLPPQSSWSENADYTVDAAFSGYAITSRGLSEPFEQDMSIVVSCMGGWCGTTEDAESIMFFGRVDEGKIHQHIEACPPWSSHQPDADEIEAVIQAISRI
jgi:hypothetical protein